MKTVQNLTVGANYLDDLFTRDELLKADCFKKSSLDKYVKKLVSLSSPLVTDAPKNPTSGLDALRQDVMNKLGNSTPKSDFSGDIENVKFPLGFIKGCTAYTTYQLYLICWLQERQKSREPLNNTKLRLLRNEPSVLFHDDTMQNPVTLSFKQVLIKVKEYRDSRDSQVKK